MSDKLLDTSQLINGAAILLSFYVGYKYGISISSTSEKKYENKNEQKSFIKKFIPDCKNYKMLLIVRNDLKMGKGKIAAQCGHAAVAAYQKTKQRNPDILRQWEYTGCAKIALKVESEKDLMTLKKDAEHLNYVTSLIRDAGRTQIEPNSKTVLAIGPASSNDLDKITGHLKLL